MKNLNELVPERLRSGSGRWVALLALLLLVTGAGAAVALMGDEDLPEGAAFRVDDEVVDVEKLDARIDALQALYGVKVPKGAERDTFRRDAAKSYAIQLMIEDAAKDRDIVIADKLITDTLDSLIEQRYPDGNRDAFVKALGELGASEAQVRDEIEQQMIVSRLFDEVTQDVEVTSEEVRSAFDERRSELATPQRRSLRNIVVQTKRDAKQVLRALDAGATFDALARQVSIDSSTREKGGNLGLVAAGQMESAYAKAAFRARAGSVFGPIRSEHGWNVGKVEKVLPGKAATFAAVRRSLKTSLETEESLTVWQDWLKDLIRDHDVTYADDYQPEDPDEVPVLPGEGTE